MSNTTQEFKNKIATVDGSGKRSWIYALQPTGRLYRWRTIATWVYLIILVTLPFLSFHGEPLFLLNFTEGKFIFFGKIFLPQDFILFGLAMLTFLLFIIVFTLAYGRIFCGWICPQTIFMEMVFRKIEYWIEGPANKQMIQDRETWTRAVYFKKGLKHLIFFGLSFLIANVFLSYIIGVKALTNIITEPVSRHWVGFSAILVFSLVFYLVFAFARELVCTVVCPYGRLQGVLLDKNSIVVAYDYIRGEPRAKVSRHREASAGDCIDCDLCVKVCPTGIDIRNGTQMECTNCTACIDACNMMMVKTGRPPDLIRYDSENNIQSGIKSKWNYRIKFYSVVLVGLLGLMSFFLLDRAPFDTTILRVPGQLLQENEDGTIGNLYRMKIINKSSFTRPYHLVIRDSATVLVYAGKAVDSLASGQGIEEMFFIRRPRETIQERKEIVHLDVYSGAQFIESKKVTFIGQY
ncbi:MAG: cytochrome c oxidase accessory protein CcoG [Saprospiraceae bacterium]|nr:cytochrome c oxidase accessory protein CcoG [Saprospiraceae bacterium]